MRGGTCPSLKRHLVTRLIAVQAAVIALVVVAVFVALWLGGHFASKLEPEDAILEAVARALGRDSGGGLVLRPTRQLDELRRRSPDLWFVVRDAEGAILSEGRVPEEYARIGAFAMGIGQARFGWNLGDPPRQIARLKQMDTAAGRVQVLTGPGSYMPLRRVVWAVAISVAGIVLPIVLVMALATLTATPLVVGRALSGLRTVADKARHIDAGRRGGRLPLDGVPAEVVPLVTAVNDALARLDDGYERRQRFLVDAAHELRTPIAILTTRLEALDESPQRQRLLADAARLSNLAGQLLDLQRIDAAPCAMTALDLVALAREVAADLAPLAIAAGFELSFEARVKTMMVRGDPLGLARALTNLVQNAIDHAGRPGLITITVAEGGIVEIADDGNGIPQAQREQIFEPFQRLDTRSHGTGLGLHLVVEIVRLHGGTIAVVDAPGGGACFRITLPQQED